MIKYKKVFNFHLGNSEYYEKEFEQPLQQPVISILYTIKQIENALQKFTLLLELQAGN